MRHEFRCNHKAAKMLFWCENPSDQWILATPTCGEIAVGQLQPPEAVQCLCTLDANAKLRIQSRCRPCPVSMSVSFVSRWHWFSLGTFVLD